MADASHVIVDDEDIASAETNVESVVSNNNSTIKKKDYKDVNELHEELSHPSEATTQAPGEEMILIVTGKF